MEITYETILPVLKQEAWENNMVRCTFQIDGKDPILAFGQVSITQNEIRGSLMKQGIAYSAIRGISRAFGRMFGGTGGAIASAGMDTIAYTVAASGRNNNAHHVKLTVENKKEAVVAAFKTVNNFFRYDEENQQWISAF